MPPVERQEGQHERAESRADPADHIRDLDPGGLGAGYSGRMCHMGAKKDGGVVSALVLEAHSGGLHGRPDMGQQPHRDGRRDEHGRGDDHGERRMLPALFGFALLLRGLFGHLRILARRVTEPVEDTSRHPEHGPADQDGADDEDGGDPGHPVRAAGFLDPALAEERAERREIGQPQGGEGEHRTGDPQVTAAAVQPCLVDRAQPVQDDADAEEQGGLHQTMAYDVDGGAGQPQGGQPAQADQEHSGVADGGKGQQALEVTFAEAEQGPHDGGQQPQSQECVSDGGPVTEGIAEHGPVHPGDAVQSQLHHHTGEEHADRCGSHGVRVGQPEVERHDRALDQQSHQDEDKGHHDEAIGFVTGDVPADLRHVEGTGPPVDETDTGQ